MKLHTVLTDIEPINRNLEAMARQLYDYWFVQFDFPDENGRPYKSSGGKMVYNERLKRDIPTSWIVKKMIDFAEIKNGATPSTANEANYGGDIVWITPKDLSDQKSKFVYYGERNITREGFDSCSTSMLPVDSVLMSSRAPIGLVSIAKCELCTNQGFKNFVPHDLNDSIYLYYYIRHHIKQLEQLGSGTTFKEVSREDLCKFPILIISDNIVYTKWTILQKIIANKQFVLTKEIEALTKQRDELLPLLMNGQVNCDLLITEIQAKVLGQCEYFRILRAGAWMRENVVGGGCFFSGKMGGGGWILVFFGYICRLKLLTSLNFCTHEQDLHHTPQRHFGGPRTGVLAGEGVPV